VPQAEVGSSASSYEILAKLATGGMAEIFLARGASTAGIERYVVLKRILRERATDASFVRMFLDEAKLAAQLQHPNIAQVYDIGKLGDSYFFTMEYVHGETVRALLHRSHALRRPVPIGSVLTVAAGAAAGLHHAHGRNGMDGKPLGIVHRDVSPSNLMVSYEGTVKVVDFGVAKAAHNSQETRSGTVKGKIAYLSPEQCRGRAIDRRSDLFSLGIVLWEMLTTERLFRHPSDFEAMAAIVNEPTPPPSSRRPEVPPEVDQVVLRLLAKEPDERYATAADLLEDLEHLAVRAQVPLSTAGLGRVVRELFGQRPEPWIELKSSEEHAHVVTVTSEPVPADLGLESVPSLQARASDARPTRPMRADALDAVPTASMSAAEVAMGPPPMVPALATPSSPFVSPGSNPFSQTGSVHQMPPGSVSQQHAAPVRKKLPVFVWVLGPAALLGVVLGLVIGLGGKKKQPPPAEGSAIAMVSIDAALPAAAVDAAVPMAIDAAPVVIDAAAVVIDAAAPPPIEHHAPVRKPPEDVTAMKPADAMTVCAGSPSVLAANPVTCTIAACKAHDLPRAKHWLASVPSAKKSSVTSACPALAPKVDTSDACKHDPLACQH
jgi:serine/threonine protein kinase